jgi:hypothetical protein
MEHQCFERFLEESRKAHWHVSSTHILSRSQLWSATLDTIAATSHASAPRMPVSAGTRVGVPEDSLTRSGKPAAAVASPDGCASASWWARGLQVGPPRAFSHFSHGGAACEKTPPVQPFGKRSRGRELVRTLFEVEGVHEVAQQQRVLGRRAIARCANRRWAGHGRPSVWCHQHQCRPIASCAAPFDTSIFVLLVLIGNPGREELIMQAPWLLACLIVRDREANARPNGDRTAAPRRQLRRLLKPRRDGAPGHRPARQGQEARTLELPADQRNVAHRAC